MRVGVYVDAFNVYYGGRDHCGRGMPGWRWLDLAALSASLIDPRLWPSATLARVVYCTAPRDRAGDPSSITDQQTYISALRHGVVPTSVLDGQYVPRVKSGDVVDRRGRRIASPGQSAIPAWLPAREVIGPDGTPGLRASLTTFEEKSTFSTGGSRRPSCSPTTATCAIPWSRRDYECRLALSTLAKSPPPLRYAAVLHLVRVATGGVGSLRPTSPGINSQRLWARLAARLDGDRYCTHAGRGCGVLRSRKKRT